MYTTDFFLNECLLNDEGKLRGRGGLEWLVVNVQSSSTIPNELVFNPSTCLGKTPMGVLEKSVNEFQQLQYFITFNVLKKNIYVHS